MCGIVFTNIDINEFNFRDALNLLKHRGPDYQGIVKDKLGTWGHTRLSFLDLSNKSNQPITMIDSEKLIYNGEIFNYNEFGDYRSDTLMLSDLLSQNYDLENLKLSLNKFNGFFSFAFSKKNLVYVVRDRFGEKPCYVMIDDDKFGLASEIKVLNKLNNNAVNDESLVRLAIDPFDFKVSDISKGLFETIYKNVYELRPGFILIYDAITHKISTIFWYDLKKDINKFRDLDYKDLYKDALRIRSIADVKGCFTLSGGVDSTLNCAVSKIELGNKVDSFSIVSSNKNYSEEKAININSSKITDSNRIIKEVDLMSELDYKKIIGMIKHFDAPYFDPNVVQYGLYKAINKNGYKYVIDGHGADELFSGYQWHMPHLFYYSLAQGEFKKSFEVLTCFWKMYPENYSAIYKLAVFLKSIYSSFRKKNLSEDENSTAESTIRYTEMFNRVMIKLLNNYDMTSMRSSVETRTPFLDHRLVANILSKPNKFFVGKKNKIQLRNYLYEISKIEIGNKKIGLRSYLWEILDETTIRKLLELYNYGCSVANNKYFKKINYEQINKLTPSEEVRFWKGICIGVFKS
jgi:asparagine synthase (glutamine-hydrolysing)